MQRKSLEPHEVLARKCQGFIEVLLFGKSPYLSSKLEITTRRSFELNSYSEAAAFQRRGARAQKA